MTGFDFDAVTFVTSDHHFSHENIIRFCARPFSDATEMNAVMVDRWNSVVGPDDVVLHLGDLAFGATMDFRETVALTGTLNGRRFLVPGNHDRTSSVWRASIGAKRALGRIYEAAGWTLLPEVIKGTRHGRPIVASHYPYFGDSESAERHLNLRPVDEGAPLLHGHTHDPSNGVHDGYMFHVGVEAWDFTPVSMAVVDQWLWSLDPNNRRRPDTVHINPEPVAGEQLMAKLGGKTHLTEEQMDQWERDTREIREASRPDTLRPSESDSESR